MMKRSLSVLFIGVFLLLCLIPSVGMLIGGPSPLLANESAPRTPAFLDRDGHPNPSVLADTTDYIGTRFALRPLLVSARSFLYESLLHTSAEEQVTLGENGELYYSSTLDDYCGVGLSDDELRLIAARLAEIQAQVERDGGQFVPHPATWLNQRRWEDEITITEKPPEQLRSRGLEDWDNE